MFTVRGPILTTGKPLPPAGRDPRLLLRRPAGPRPKCPSRSKVISCTLFIAARRHALSDRYRLTRCENSGRDAQRADCDAFCLVATTYEERSGVAGLTIPTVERSAGALDAGIRGAEVVN